MGRVTLFCIMLITAWLVVLSSATRGVCYRRASRYRSETYTQRHSRNYENLCTNGWWRRCRRTHAWTTYHTRQVIRYYQERVCCSRYRDHSGACRRTVIGLERSRYDVAENAGYLDVCATIQENVGIHSGGISIRMGTADGGARSTSDFGSVFSTRRFAHGGTTRQCLRISINYDYVYEGTESFSVTLSGRNMPSYAHLSRTTATVTIRNTYRIRVGFYPTSYTVDENAGTVSVCAKVYDVAGTVQDTEVSLSTSSYEARSPGDFTAISSRIAFTHSSRRRQHCVNISVIHDHLHEGTERFTVRLTSSVPQVTTDPASATVYIRNSHRLTIGFEQTTLQVSESAGNFSACVRILQPGETDRLPSNSFSVGIRTHQNQDEQSPAHAPEDFAHSSQVVNLTSSTRRQCLIIPIVHDALFEETEVFFISLFRSTTLPSYVTLSPNIAVVRIVQVHRLTIGFEQINLPVSEQAGHVPVCVRVLEPTGPYDSIEDTHYSVGLATNIIPGIDRASAQDFTVVSTPLTLTTALRRQCVNISITSDHIFETYETFTVELSRISLPSYVVLTPDIARVAIYDVVMCEQPQT